MAPCAPARPRYHTYLSRTRANTSYDTPISVLACVEKYSCTAHSTHFCTIQKIVQFLGAFTDTDNSKPLDPQHITPREPKHIHSPRTPSASGSSVPPCPTFTLSLRATLFLPAFFSSFSFSTKRRELQTSFFNWSTTCIDVGPDGFITPKRPDRGSEGGVFGILERYESSHEGLSYFVY